MTAACRSHCGLGHLSASAAGTRSATGSTLGRVRISVPPSSPAAAERAIDGDAVATSTRMQQRLQQRRNLGRRKLRERDRRQVERIAEHRIAADPLAPLRVKPRRGCQAPREDAKGDQARGVHQDPHETDRANRRPGHQRQRPPRSSRSPAARTDPAGRWRKARGRPVGSRPRRMRDVTRAAAARARVGRRARSREARTDATADSGRRAGRPETAACVVRAYQRISPMRSSSPGAVAPCDDERR